MFNRVAPAPIRTITELVTFLEANPDMKIAHIVVDKQGNLRYSKKLPGARPFFMRNRAKECDAQRWNNWRVGIALNDMAMDKNHRTAPQWKYLFGLDGAPTSVNRRFAEVHGNTTAIQLAKVYMAIREYKMPVFETNAYQARLETDVLPFYYGLASKGEYVKIGWDDEDAFLGHSHALPIPKHNLRLQEFDTSTPPVPPAPPQRLDASQPEIGNWAEHYQECQLDKDRVSVSSAVLYRDVRNVGDGIDTHKLPVLEVRRKPEVGYFDMDEIAADEIDAALEEIAAKITTAEHLKKHPVMHYLVSKLEHAAAHRPDPDARWPRHKGCFIKIIKEDGSTQEGWEKNQKIEALKISIKDTNMRLKIYER